jgi:diguanylate cyclase
MSPGVDHRPIHTLPPRAAALVRGLIAFCVAGALLYAAGTLFSLPGTDLLLDDILSHIVMAAAAALCALRARWIESERRAWLALAAGIMLWNGGSLLYDIALGFDATPPFPHPSDALWLAFYPAAYIALGLLVRERLRHVAWLDGAIGAAAAGAVAAAVIFEPVRSQTGGSFAAVAVNLAYPLADLLLAGFLVLVLAAEGWRARPSRVLLGAAFALLLVIDTVYLMRVSAGVYHENTLLDAGWPAAMVLLGLAAWRAGNERRSSPRVQSWVAMAAPSVFTVVAIGLLIYGNARPLGALAVVLATVTLLLGAVRTGLSFRTVQELALRRRQATTDELTGLANRRLLYHRLDRAIVARRGHGPLALLLIDLDGFKEINDSLGHNAGDIVLRQIGPRLHDAIRGGDLLARLGGDEFAVLLDGAGMDEALTLAARVRKALERPIEIEGLELMVDASVGVATHPEHGDDAEALLQHADVAMYHAKAARTGCEVYTPARDASSRDRLALLGRLRHAIEGGELVVHYQPKADLRSGRVDAVEALVRWQHPDRGLLMPGDFLPAAEQTALMRPLTLRVLDTALADCRRWLDDGRRLGVAVNLAVPNLLDRGFPAEVAAALDRHGVPAALLQLEITESTVMADPARALEVIDALRALGLGLSLDDFGTGHSSLSYLRRLAVDEIKIDRSFVSEMVADADAAAIVRCTVDLGRSLRLRVVAEGAEDDATWSALQAAGCQVGQGYFLSRPVPAAALEAWLAARDTVAAVRPRVPTS